MKKSTGLYIIWKRQQSWILRSWRKCWFRHVRCRISGKVPVNSAEKTLLQGWLFISSPVTSSLEVQWEEEAQDKTLPFKAPIFEQLTSTQLWVGFIFRCLYHSFVHLGACKVERISIKLEDPSTIYADLEIYINAQYKKKPTKTWI